MPRANNPKLSVILLASCMIFSSCAQTGTGKRSFGRRSQDGNASQTPVGEAATPPATRKIFIALMGGRGTCDRFPTMAAMRARTLTPDYAEFGKLLKDLDGKMPVKPTYFVSCLPNGTPLRDDFQYFTSADESKPGAVAPNRGKLNAVETLIASMAREANEVYLTGHSYGGWSAMKVAPAVGAARRINVLMTLDPISAVTCTPATGVLQFFSTAGNSCNESPRDFGASGLRSIRAATDKWINFYQTANRSLHSSAIPEVAENEKLDFPAVGPINGLIDYRNPHFYVGTGSQAWSRLAALINK